MARKRIYNPVTGKYYKVQERDGERRRGQIKGLWHNDSKGEVISIWNKLRAKSLTKEERLSLLKKLKDILK